MYVSTRLECAFSIRSRPAGSQTSACARGAHQLRLFFCTFAREAARAGGAYIYRAALLCCLHHAFFR
jgi:hypothetical protein